MAGNPIDKRVVLFAYAAIVGLAALALTAAAQAAALLAAGAVIAILLVVASQLLLQRHLSALSAELRQETAHGAALLRAVEGAGQASAVIADRRLIEVNDLACTLLGYPREQLLALDDFTSLVAPADRTALIEAFRSTASEGKPTALKVEVVRGDGKRGTAEFSAAPFEGPGGYRVLFVGHPVVGAAAAIHEDLPPISAATAGGPLRPLSPRERQVLELVARGYSNQDIAEALEISLKTVEVHTVNIRKKLPIRNRVQMVRYALQHGLVHLNDDQSGSRRRARS